MSNNILYHHKYTSKKRVNGKWRYYYGDEPSQGSNSSDIPSAYKPSLKETTYAGRKGYVDENGLFYEGDYHTVRHKKYQRDLKLAEAKAQDQLAEQRYRNSAKRHVDDCIKDLGKLADIGSKTISKGAKAVSDFFKKLFD